MFSAFIPPAWNIAQIAWANQKRFQEELVANEVCALLLAVLSPLSRLQCLVQTDRITPQDTENGGVAVQPVVSRTYEGTPRVHPLVNNGTQSLLLLRGLIIEPVLDVQRSVTHPAAQAVNQTVYDGTNIIR